MPLVIGTRLGPYEITAPLGSGGMGEVYKARDTRLDRTVAIKVLPPQLADDPQFRERFDREARAVAALNHPHICILHDIGSQDDVDFLVMEYLEGETLARRLEKGPLPLNQALQYAIQIADALAAAHRAGITHRDLKPGNVMLVKSGSKLLDFGLAKSTGPAKAGHYDRPGQEVVGRNFSSAVTAEAGLEGKTRPTYEAALTAQGTILGTFQYMAPEQLEGKDADARTDIFAFGALVYEMVTGKKAFEGKSQASLIGAIMTSDPPPIASLQPLAPPVLDRIVKTCLAKELAERWQSAKDLWDVLRWSASGDLTDRASQSERPRKRGALIAWTTAAVGLVVAVALALLRVFESSPPASPLRFSVSAPPDTFFLFSSTSTPAGQSVQVVSPDGKHLAFQARRGTEPVSIWVRSLEALAARRLAGTEGAALPF